MKKRIMYCLFMVVILSSACSTISQEQVLSMKKKAATVESQIWNYTSKEMISPIAVADGMFVFHDMGSNDTGFYTVDLNTGEEKNIGVVSNYFMNGRAAKLNSGMVYIYITTVHAESGLSNDLYKIDCSKNQLTLLSCDNICTPMISLFGIGDTLISLKNVNGEDSYSYFEEIDPNDGSAVEVLHSDENEVYVAANEAAGCLYVLCYKEVLSGEFTFYIRVYSLSNYEQKEIISLNNIREYLLEARIGTINIFGEYILFENYSNETLICKIKAEEVSEVLRERHLVLVSDITFEDIAQYVFYKRATNKCFVFNPIDESMSAIELDIAGGYSIQKIFVDGEQIVVKGKLYEEIKQTGEKGNICLFNYQYFIKKIIGSIGY